MGFVKFDPHGRLLDATGNPIHLVGINYVASYICSNFWEDWRPDHIERDLKRIHDLGLQAVRIPMHWGYMEPEPGKFNGDFETRFRWFVETCRKYALYIMPWFLVGIATREYDVPYRNGRPFCTGEMVQLEQAHLKHFIAPYRDEEQILFWDICDEPEWFSRFPNTAQLPYDREVMVQWVQSMYDAIRSVDPNHLITLGFGHIATANYGMDVRDMAAVLDLMAVTAYPNFSNEGIDTVRNNYCLPYHVKMNARGKPVFTCEAPGYSTIQYSEAVVSRFVKASLYGNLLSGSVGVLPWVYTDFEESLWHQVPLEGYTIEPGFGFWNVDGRLKPHGEVLREYAAFSKKAELGKYRPQPAEVAILVPDGYYEGAVDSVFKVYTAMILAKGCGAAVDLVWTTEELSRYKMLIMPSCAGMRTSSWDKVRRFVENGGLLYFLYDGGQNAYFNRLFGVEVETQERNPGYRAMGLTREWGKWPVGSAISFAGKGDVLRITPESAQVLCRFEDGEPALLKNSYGQGTAYLAAIQLDSGLLEVPYRQYLACDSFAMVDTMLREAGVRRIAVCDHSAMEVGCLENPDTGEKLILCVNHEKTAVKTTVTFDGAFIPEEWKITRFDDGTPVGLSDALELEPAGVAVYRMTRNFN